MILEPDSGKRSSRPWLWMWLTVGALLLVIGAILWWRSGPSAERHRELARQALQRKDEVAARRHLSAALEKSPDSSESLLLAGVVERALGDFDRALEYLARIPDETSVESVEARYLAGEILLQDRRQPAAAEPLFRRALAQDESHLLARDRLCYILGLAVRAWDLVPQQLAALRIGNVAPQRMYALAMGDRLTTDPQIIEDLRKVSPDDAVVVQGSAQIDAVQGRHELARTRLEKLLEHQPELGDAQVQLGRLLLEHGAPDRFVHWSEALPKVVNEHPGVWVLRGTFEQQQGRRESAARCFWEAVRRDPNQQSANYQLGLLLSGLGRSTAAEPFLRRANKLERYVQTVNVQVWNDMNDKASAVEFRKLAVQADELGLIWETAAWNRMADISSSSGKDDGDFLLNVPPDTPLVRTPPDLNPAAGIDLQEYPLPSGLVVTRALIPADSSTGQVTFEEASASAGIDFRYFNDDDRSVPGQRIFETIGGGVAVLDFDLDGLPDLYFTQGCRWPPGPEHSEFLDKLYRNRGNGRFTEVAQTAGIREPGYGQGVTAGDFDNDGFTDLYVSNIGPNRFFHNNGDGTFRDATAQTSTACGGWSTSCVLADLNGDSFPDLYVVTYLQGADLFRMVCRNADGSPRVCSPNIFEAAQDHVFLNLGDGRFEEQSGRCGIIAPEGRGLGIVAADFNGSGKLSLYVANDQSPSFLFVNQTPPRGRQLRFVEEGLSRGVAMDGNGRTQASMGIAADDADGDGLIDLFVTTFADETNTLFLQQPEMTFVDETPRSGLGPPSLDMLGFGTQFIDGELDGRPDLIVTNGHVDDQSSRGGVYQMPPQYFRNLGAGRFQELPAKALGPFFQQRHLGRGLARLDWNRDGLEDVAISQLESRAALLTNTTTRHGRGLSLHLRGMKSSRDAIGAIATVTLGQTRLVRQLTAGDGFHASNERTLVFGLGHRDRVDDLLIRWPSGLEQHFVNLTAGRFLLIEGEPSPVEMH